MRLPVSNSLIFLPGRHKDATDAYNKISNFVKDSPELSGISWNSRLNAPKASISFHIEVVEPNETFKYAHKAIVWIEFFG